MTKLVVIKRENLGLKYVHSKRFIKALSKFNSTFQEGDLVLGVKPCGERNDRLKITREFKGQKFTLEYSIYDFINFQEELEILYNKYGPEFLITSQNTKHVLVKTFSLEGIASIPYLNLNFQKVFLIGSFFYYLSDSLHMFIFPSSFAFHNTFLLTTTFKYNKRWITNFRGNPELVINFDDLGDLSIILELFPLDLRLRKVLIKVKDEIFDGYFDIDLFTLLFDLEDFIYLKKELEKAIKRYENSRNRFVNYTDLTREVYKALFYLLNSFNVYNINDQIEVRAIGRDVSISFNCCFEDMFGITASSVPPTIMKLSLEEIFFGKDFWGFNLTAFRDYFHHYMEKGIYEFDFSKGRLIKSGWKSFKKHVGALLKGLYFSKLV